MKKKKDSKHLLSRATRFHKIKKLKEMIISFLEIMLDSN